MICFHWGCTWLGGWALVWELGHLSFLPCGIIREILLMSDNSQSTILFPLKSYFFHPRKKYYFDLSKRKKKGFLFESWCFTYQFPHTTFRGIIFPSLFLLFSRFWVMSYYYFCWRISTIYSSIYIAMHRHAIICTSHGSIILSSESLWGKQSLFIDTEV